jgi:hypothetical protein
MREEEVGEYRRITVRLTVRATLKALADFLETVEYGSMQLSVPFLQIDGRAAKARRRAKSKSKQDKQRQRVLSATLEVRGLAASGKGAPEKVEKS